MPVGAAVGKHANLAAFHIHYGELVAVENECKLFAVGRHFCSRAFMLVRFEQSFFVDYCGMGEVVTLVAASHCGFIDVETPVALRGVYKRAVRSPAQVALGFGGIGDLFGRTVVDRCHVDIATVYERYGLSVGRCHCIFSP